MHLHYVPNRHVHDALPGAAQAFTKPLFDEYGMVPYQGNPQLLYSAARISNTAREPALRRPRSSSRIDIGDEAISFAPIIMALGKYCAAKPFYQEIEFIVSNNTTKVRVEAVIYAGTLNCLITPFCDELLRKLLLSRKEAARDLYQKTNFVVHLDIADEIRTGKL